MTRYAFITGASSGIGYALCKAFAKRGIVVFGCSPQREVALMDPLKEFGIIPLACDITNTEDIRRVKEIIRKETGGRLDYLYNNAGIAIGGPACESLDEDVLKIFQVNVFGHIAVTREFTDFVVATKGTIMYTALVAGRVAFPFTSLYCATKAAIDQFAHVLSMEMKPLGVKVVSVITGGVNTAIADRSADKFDPTVKLYFNVPSVAACITEVSMMARKCVIPVQPDEYAERVVGYVERGNPALNIYKGGLATILNYLGRYNPIWVQEAFLGRYFKFNAVAAEMRKRGPVK